MSSEQRIKKLRGSGGYIMASVNDEQQRKGNLGGPDLFLAPIGRLESDKISKYFCNTCENDYEGSPRIDFENPNEEVAENLVLTERGQYVCSTCGSTIAEYREFTKPNEQNDAGLAKPIEFEAPQTFSEPAETLEPSEQTPQFDIQTTDTESLIEEPVTAINPIVGMSVFDDNGVRVGTAKQVGVDASQNIVLVITKNDGDDAVIVWSRIKKVGEIILLGNKSDSESQPQVQSAGTCSSCGFVNKTGSKFCEQCGNNLHI